jgi:putative endonuclease
MALHNQIGKKGEDEAVLYLLSMGATILERNYRYDRAEIDIIAKIENIIVFVEVKTRTQNNHGNPEDFLSLAQQKRIVKAATYYLENIPENLDIRFDIISILKNKELEHIEDAFFLVGDE